MTICYHKKLKWNRHFQHYIYRSSSKLHRLIVETSLITLCTTVKDTKASSNVRDMDTIGPIILRAAQIDWKALAKVQPNLSNSIVPKTHQRFFGFNNPINPASSFGNSSSLDTRPPDPPLEVTHGYLLRSSAGTTNDH